MVRNNNSNEENMQAIWNGAVIAESDKTVVVDGNHYFPMASIHREYFKESKKTTVCSWKGTANYFTLSVNGDSNPDAAWYYAAPKSAASEIKNHVAFWRGVEVK